MPQLFYGSGLKACQLLTSGLKTNVGRRDATSFCTNATTEVTGVPVTGAKKAGGEEGQRDKNISGSIFSFARGAKRNKNTREFGNRESGCYIVRVSCRYFGSVSKTCG